MTKFISCADLEGAGIRSACIRSLERSLYLVELEAAEGRLVLGADGRSARVFRSLAAARAAIAPLGAVPLRLLHESSYDEMIGLESAPSTRLQLELGPIRG